MQRAIGQNSLIWEGLSFLEMKTIWVFYQLKGRELDVWKEEKDSSVAVLRTRKVWRILYHIRCPSPFEGGQPWIFSKENSLYKLWWDEEGSVGWGAICLKEFVAHRSQSDYEEFVEDQRLKYHCAKEWSICSELLRELMLSSMIQEIWFLICLKEVIQWKNLMFLFSN